MTFQNFICHSSVEDPLTGVAVVQRLPYSQSVSAKYTTCVPEASTDGVSGLKVSPVIPGSDDSERIVANNSGSLAHGQDLEYPILSLYRRPSLPVSQTSMLAIEQPSP